MGLTCGPVPPRVDAEVKAGLLDLVDHAVDAGWSRRRACEVLQLNPVRAGRWRTRRDGGEDLTDRRSGPEVALHGLLDDERAAILELFDQWGEVDRSHRKLAHRGSRLGVVHVSESSVLRVLRAEQLVLPAPPARDPSPRRPWPDWGDYRPCQVWGHDFSAFMRADRDVLAILDLVSRRWIDSLLVAHGRGVSQDLVALYTRALDREGLMPQIEARMIAPNSDDEMPVLLAVSDGGPQMVSGTTREWMALHSLALHVGRPGTPTDQAHIESFFGHVKREWPHLETIEDPATLARELDAVRRDYNSVRLHAGIGYVTPDDEHHGRGPQLRKARADGLKAARARRIAYRRNNPTDTT